jgi:hypothetical protein
MDVKDTSVEAGDNRRGRAGRLRERAAGAGRARHGHAAGCSGVRRVGGQGECAAVGPAGAGRVRRGDVRGAGGRAGAGRRRDPGERAGPRHRPAGRRTGRAGSAGRRQDGSGRAARAVVRTPDERLTWLQALGSRRKEDVTAGIPALFTGFLITDGYKAYQGLLPRLGGVQQCCQHVIRRCRAVTKLGPGSLQSWAADVISILREAHQAVEEARARGDTALDPEQLDKLRQRYDEAAAFGITHNRLRDWHDGNHPGYALGCWLQEYKEQVWLFTREFAVEWTTNSAERAVKGPKRHQAVSGYWHTQRTLARWCRIRSYLDSARNHGLRALDAIRAALEGKPWLPPLPALA